ncbi:SpoIIE family protein phosphatase [Streptomyces fagopyri]|uniref:SpoIIE family protein phosphatase n=1 Tax=Streptomyces fagopyri TaxID=2662397 RepID=UPI0036B80CDB
MPRAGRVTECGGDHLATPGGQSIGVSSDAHVSTTTVRPGPGDTLLLYTDGLTAADLVSAGRRYGDEAPLECVREPVPTTARGTVKEIRDPRDTFGTGVDDDTAVLALHVPRSRS